MPSPQKTITAIALVFLLVSLVPGQTESPWVSWAPADDGFSVLLPGTPDVQKQQTPILGNNYEMRMYTSIEAKSGLVFIVVMQELPTVTAVLTPDKKLDSFMGGFQEGFSKSLPNMKVEMKLERDLALKGNYGRQYGVSVAETRGLARVYDGGHRVYLLMAMGGSETHARRSEERRVGKECGYQCRSRWSPYH